MSQKTLTAPNMAAGSVEEMKVISGANTASPSPTPSAMKVQNILYVCVNLVLEGGVLGF